MSHHYLMHNQTLIQRKAVLILCLDSANYLSQADHLDMVIPSLVRMYENYPGLMDVKRST